LQGLNAARVTGGLHQSIRGLAVLRPIIVLSHTRHSGATGFQSIEV
jgi:hypothetical protein